MKNGMKYYNIVIIGAGPAGMFTAYYILKNSNVAKVLLVDKGSISVERKCCGQCAKCLNRKNCSVLCGVGGAGLFSDGKLVMDLHAGGKIDAISTLSEKEKKNLTDYIVKTLKKYDGVSELSPEISETELNTWKDRFEKEGLSIRHYDVLHMGTNNLCHITTNFIKDLLNNPRFSLKSGSEVTDIYDAEDQKSSICMKNGERYLTSCVVFSVGKTGSEWLKKIFLKNHISCLKTKTYIGVRLETSHDSVKELFKYSFDPKIWSYYGNQKVKTHCFCRHGEIICSNYMGYPVIGGHTRFTENNHVSEKYLSQKTNFNVLISTNAEKKEILRILDKLKNLNSNGGVVQYLLDFLHYERKGKSGDLKKCYVYGDLRSILDELDHAGEKIADFIIHMSKIFPGILDSENLVYGPALEWLMDSVEVDHYMETSHKNWFAVGDGAGLSQGIVHAAATGIIAAHELCRRMEA